MENLRGLLGIRMDRVPNAWIRESWRVTKGVDKSIDEGVLRWFGHVERMEKVRIAKRVYVVSSLNPIKATHVHCNMFLSIYIIQIFKILLPILRTSSSPCANLPFPPFILLQLSTFPPFALLSYFHLHPHSSSF